MILRGDCLACSKINACQTTNVEKAQTGYTCVLFDPAPEPVFAARWTMMQQVGEVPAIRAMLAQKIETEEDDD
jgi:hypothetical protein